MLGDGEPNPRSPRMKKMIAVSIIACLSSVSFAQEAKPKILAELKLKMNQVYSQTAEKTFQSKMTTNTTSVSVQISGADGTQKQWNSAEKINQKEAGAEIKVLGLDTVQLSDLDAKTSLVVKADIKSNSIRVASKDVLASLAAELEKNANELAKVLNIDSSYGTLKFDMQLSDMNCSAADKTLTCTTEAKLILEATKK